MTSTKKNTRVLYGIEFNPYEPLTIGLATDLVAAQIVADCKVFGTSQETFSDSYNRAIDYHQITFATKLVGVQFERAVNLKIKVKNLKIYTALFPQVWGYDQFGNETKNRDRWA